MRARRCAGGLVLALLTAASGAAPALPEDALLGGLAGDLRAPQHQCEWIAGQFTSIELTLSLYREDLAAFYVTLDGQSLGDSSSGSVLAIEFESRRTGPGSAAIALDGTRLAPPSALAKGRRIDVGFTDRGGARHPLFCGQLAVLRADATSRSIEIVALMPRSGSEGQSSARFTNMSLVDVLKQQAEDAGLAIEVQDRQRRERQASVTRERLAAWPFMRSLARQCGFDFVLRPGGALLATESAFAPPARQAEVRNDLTVVEIVKRIAQHLGHGVNAQLTAHYPPIPKTNVVLDEPFMAAVAAAWRISAWYEQGAVFLAEDGVWNAPPAAATQTSAGADELFWRITATGSAGPRRSFTRQPADPDVRRQNEERVPLLQTTLLLGHAMKAVSPPRFELADHAAIAAAFDLAISRLRQSADLTPERRFLLDYAMSHRPTLIHAYRLRPDGIGELGRIGR